MRTFANKSSKERGVLATMYFTAQQIRDITYDAGDIGYLLMTFYVGIAHQTNPNMEDAHMSTLTGKPITTIRDARLRLTKAGWFLRTKTTIKGEKHIMYAVGKEAVTKGLSGSFAILP